MAVVVRVAMWLIRLPDIGNQTVPSKPAYVADIWCVTREDMGLANGAFLGNPMLVIEVAKVARSTMGSGVDNLAKMNWCTYWPMVWHNGWRGFTGLFRMFWRGLGGRSLLLQSVSNTASATTASPWHMQDSIPTKVIARWYYRHFCCRARWTLVISLMRWVMEHASSEHEIWASGDRTGDECLKDTYLSVRKWYRKCRGHTTWLRETFFVT